MNADLVKIIASLITLKDEIEDSNNRKSMELDEVIDELERMVLDSSKDMPDDEDAMGMYPWHNKPHEEEG